MGIDSWSCDVCRFRAMPICIDPKSKKEAIRAESLILDEDLRPDAQDEGTPVLGIHIDRFGSIMMHHRGNEQAGQQSSQEYAPPTGHGQDADELYSPFSHNPHAIEHLAARIGSKRFCHSV